MATVTNWVLKCKEMKKVKGGKYLMRCIFTSKDQQGNYYDPMWISVFIGKDTEWKKADYTDVYVTVSGNFFHSDSEYRGTTYKNFSIWAESVEPFEFEDKKKKKKKAAPKKKSRNNEEEDEDDDDFMSLPDDDDDDELPF